VVKDPTQPGPSLVTEVKDSSLTILHQFYPNHMWFLQQLQVQGETGRNYRGFSAGGRTTLRRVARGKRRRNLGKGASRYSLYGLGRLLPISEGFTQSYYLLELGTSWRGGGHTAD
jgi:hypothetical protein